MYVLGLCVYICLYWVCVYTGLYIVSVCIQMYVLCLCVCRYMYCVCVYAQYTCMYCVCVYKDVYIVSAPTSHYCYLSSNASLNNAMQTITTPGGDNGHLHLSNLAASCTDQTRDQTEHPWMTGETCPPGQGTTGLGDTGLEHPFNAYKNRHNTGPFICKKFVVKKLFKK